MNNLSWIEKLLEDLNAEVVSLYHRQHYEQASEIAHKSLRIARQTFGPRHQYVFTAQDHIGAIQRAQKRLNLDPLSGQPGNIDDMGRKPRYIGASLALKAAIMVLVGLLFLTATVFFDAPSMSANDKTGASAALAPDNQFAHPHYMVQAHFYPEQRLIKGQISASFNLGVPQGQLLFNLYLNRYQDPALNSSQVRQYALKRNFKPGAISIKQVTGPGGQLIYQEQGQYLVITPKEGLFEAGGQQLTIEFEVQTPQGPDRAGGNQHGLWLGHWLPTLAVTNDIAQYPATEIGDPYVNFAATYEVMFTVPLDYELVLSNTQVQEQWQNTRVYTGTLKLVRDLPVFLHRDYQKSSLQTSGVEINYYYRDHYSNQVLPAAKQAVDYYSAHVGAYPWQQLNVVENDMYLSGMEYATMVLISKNAVLQNPVGTVFHEVGHQWFYNIIGSDQYRHGFLDEGLVEFMTKYALDQPIPRYTTKLPDFNQGLNQFTNWQQYRTVHYVGGEEYFANLHSKLGEKGFNDLMREYYRCYQYRLVTLDEWQHFLNTQTGLTWDELR